WPAGRRQPSARVGDLRAAGRRQGSAAGALRIDRPSRRRRARLAGDESNGHQLQLRDAGARRWRSGRRLRRDCRATAELQMGVPRRAARPAGCTIDRVASSRRLRRQPARGRAGGPGRKAVPALLVADDGRRRRPLFAGDGPVKRAVAFTVLAVAGFLLAGCGSDHAVSLGSPQEPTSASQETPTTTGQATAPLSFDVWFARGEQLVSERRTHARTPRVATAAASALLAGPTSAERAAGVKTAIPAGTRLLGVSINDGVATVDLTSQYQSGGGSPSMQVRLGQVVYTLTQFPTVKSVRFALDGAPVNVFSSEGIVLGHPVGRADYRDLALGTATPAAAELPGNWQSLSRAPVPIDAYLSAVWTGHEALLYGVTGVARDGNFLKASNGAEAYNPATRTWRRLPTPPGPRESVGNHPAVWTGTEMIVWPSKAFNPGTNRWRTLPHAPTM